MDVSQCAIAQRLKHSDKNFGKYILVSHVTKEFVIINLIALEKTQDSPSVFPPPLFTRR